VARGITFADLKGTLTDFARRVLGAHARVRFRAFVLPVHRAERRSGCGMFVCGGRDARSEELGLARNPRQRPLVIRPFWRMAATTPGVTQALLRHGNRKPVELRNKITDTVTSGVT